MMIISTFSTPSGILVFVAPVFGSTLIQSGKGDPSFITPSYLTISEPVSLKILNLRFKLSFLTLTFTLSAKTSGTSFNFSLTSIELVSATRSVNLRPCEKSTFLFCFGRSILFKSSLKLLSIFGNFKFDLFDFSFLLLSLLINFSAFLSLISLTLFPPF